MLDPIDAALLENTPSRIGPPEQPVMGIDADAGAVAATRRRGHAARRCAIERMPFADASFDLVTCLDVIEHTPDDRRTLLLSPLALLIPLGTLLHHVGEWSFARKWAREFDDPQHRRRIVSGRQPQSREAAA